MNSIVKIQPNEQPKIEYVGYYKMLEKILSLMDKGTFEDKMKLIDKYIELTRIINKEKEPIN